MKEATRIARAERGESRPGDAIVLPIVLSNTFARAPDPCFDYGRGGNPTRARLEEVLARLERAEHGIAFASGMAAIAALFQTVERGDEIVFDRRSYAGTLRILFSVVAPLGINVRLTDVAAEDLGDLVTASTRIVWLETPTNPLLETIDIRRVADRLKGTRALLAVDNTVATPLYQRPLELGANVVCHSTSKYLNGHGDVIGGFVATSDADLAERLRFLQLAAGAVPSPFDCYMTLRGLTTLDVRMARISSNARRVSAFLSEHPRVAKVAFPPFGGGIVTIDLAPQGSESPAACTEAFLSRLRLFDVANGFGSVTSSAEAPLSMSQRHFPEELVAVLGVTPTTVRLAIGLEDADDLVADLAQALAP